MSFVQFMESYWYLPVLVVVLAVLVIPSIRIIGPTDVGLVTKRFAFQKLPDDNPIAFRGEAGYQANLLMPGWYFKLWVIYAVAKHPWVQVRAGEIGVVVAQVGRPLPVGAKSAVSVSELNLIANLRAWLEAGGQKGVQRSVLPPGSLMPVHPVGFLVITRERIYGVPVAEQFQELQAHGQLSHQAFGLEESQLKVTVITPRSASGGGVLDTCGVVTALEGQPLPSGSIAGRIGEFEDIKKLESEQASEQTLIEALIGSKSVQHNNYQDFDAFLNAGGKIGLQHDPLLYGAYLLNPFLVFTIELVVQIHVPDTSAPRVISMVGTISNLVNEVLQAAVGNHFRDKLQSMPAVEFIETRQQVQQAALSHIRAQLTQYEVETRGVYIQDVILPKELVQVLTQREIANQEKATFQMQQEAQRLRIDLEKTKGTADMQAQLAQAQVGVDIATQTAAARKKQATARRPTSLKPDGPRRPRWRRWAWHGPRASRPRCGHWARGRRRSST
jgi:regulator of protease activity HflC (stomatin/prohibitin superfamily)